MEFLLGNFGSGKTSYIINKACDLLKENKPFYIIVPSRRHKDQLMLQLLKKEKSLIGTPVVTLSEFRKKLIEQLLTGPNVRPKIISNFEKFLIISSIIAQNEKQFKIFKNVKQRPEIVKMIYRLINSLRDKDIEKLKSSISCQDRIDDVQLILSKFQEILLHKNIGDDKFEIDLICKQLDNLSVHFLPENIFVDGFVDYTPAQFKFLTSVLQYFSDHNKNITVSLTDAPHSISQDTIESFKNIFPQARLIHLTNTNESTLLADSFLNRAKIKTSLELYEIQAVGRHKEVECIVNQIKKLYLTQQHNLEDILIITDNQDQYHNILSAAFRKVQIPYCFGKDDKLSNNSLIVFVKKCLRIIMTQELSHESIQFFAQSNYVDDQLRKILNKAPSLIPVAIQGQKISWIQAVKNQKDNCTEEVGDLQELDELETALVNLCDFLFYTEGYQEYPINMYITKLISLLEFLGVFQVLTNEYQLLKHKKIIDISIAKDYSALLKLKDILSELKNSLSNMSNDILNFQSFVFFFNIITEETRYRSEAVQKNTIKILSAKDARGIFAKSVFILGLNEGEYPALPKLELFNNFERNQLNLISHKILGQSVWDTDINFLDEQKFDFALAMTRATERIFFTRIPVNEKGVYFNISNFLKQIICNNNVVKVPHTTQMPLEDNISIFTKYHEPDEYFDSYQLKVFQKHMEFSKSIYESYNYVNDIQEANNKFNKGILPDQNKQKYFGYIPTIRKITQRYTNNKIYISPTRLEKIGRCRYQGLWQGIWNIKSSKLPVYHPESSDYGTLYHYVLEHYMKETALYSTNDVLNEDILRKHILKYIEKNNLSTVFMLDYCYIYIILKNFIKYIEPDLRENQQPLYFELESGHSELNNKEVKINTDQLLVINSKIDRVDYNELNNNYSIIDYKKKNILAYKTYQKTPFNLFQGFLYKMLLKNNNKQSISTISYIFLEKKEIFQEYPGMVAKEIIYTSNQDMENFKYKEINRLLQLLKQGNFSPFTLKEDIGTELFDLFKEKFGEKFPIEYENKCAYCEVQKLCLRKNKLTNTNLKNR